MSPYLKSSDQKKIVKKILNFLFNMKNLYLVTMRSTDGSTFAINDINEISKYFKNIYIIPLLKDLIIKKEPIYRDNVKVIRSIPKKLIFMNVFI